MKTQQIAVVNGEAIAILSMPKPETIVKVEGKASDVFKSIDCMCRATRGMSIFEGLAVIATNDLMQKRVSKDSKTKVQFNIDAIRRGLLCSNSTE